MQEILSVCYKFTWEGKADQINRNHLCMSYLDRGLRTKKINCFTEALKISWIHHIKPKTLWSQLATQIIGPFDKIGIREVLTD